MIEALGTAKVNQLTPYARQYMSIQAYVKYSFLYEYDK
jgi:hypothetical protein